MKRTAWPNNKLTETLGIQYPLIQAPMAGGITSPELVAAVSNAGGLGSLGAGYMEPEAIRQALTEIRALTNKPFAVNLFVPQPVQEDAERIMRANELLTPYREELGVPDGDPLAQELPNYVEQLGVCFEESVEIISFTFGVPGEAELETIKQLGVTTIGTATHLLEAIVLEESGLDVVVAQGVEAGGHRGTFLGSAEQGMAGLTVLLPLLADNLRIPFVAAGGIMDGRGIAAALDLGASGAQLGTAFIATPESGAHACYKETLLDSNELTTVLTRVFSGKLARGIKNRFVSELHDAEPFLPGYPMQNTLTQAIRRAAAEQDKVELMSLWAGQGCALARPLPAAELLQLLVDETEALYGHGANGQAGAAAEVLERRERAVMSPSIGLPTVSG